MGFNRLKGFRPLDSFRWMQDDKRIEFIRHQVGA